MKRLRGNTNTCSITHRLAGEWKFQVEDPSVVNICESFHRVDAALGYRLIKIIDRVLAITEYPLRILEGLGQVADDSFRILGENQSGFDRSLGGGQRRCRLTRKLL